MPFFVGCVSERTPLFFSYFCGKFTDIMHIVKLHGSIDSWGYARWQLQYDLDQVPEGEPVILEVDSLGGDVKEALSISNIISARGQVTAHIVGFCASAATWLCYAADKVVINDDCAFLIHKCSSLIDEWGMKNADEIDDLIERLKSEKKSNEAIDLLIAQKYVKHADGKITLKDTLKLMKENRWILPEEALSLGLVDEVSTEHTIVNAAARRFVMNSAGLPPMPVRQAPAEPARKSIAQQIRDVLTDFFGGRPSVESEQPVNVIMHEEFTTVNQLLNRERLEEHDGHILLTVDEVRMLNERLAAAEGLPEQVATLTTERDNALNEATATVAAIDGISEEVASMGTIEEKVGAIKNALSKAAGCATDTHPMVEGDGHAGCNDPANSYIQQYKK